MNHRRMCRFLRPSHGLLSGTSLKKELMAAGSEEVMAESFLRHAGEKHEESPKNRHKMKLLGAHPIS